MAQSGRQAALGRARQWSASRCTGADRERLRAVVRDVAGGGVDGSALRQAVGRPDGHQRRTFRPTPEREPEDLGIELQQRRRGIQRAGIPEVAARGERAAVVVATNQAEADAQVDQIGIAVDGQAGVLRGTAGQAGKGARAAADLVDRQCGAPRRAVVLREHRPLPTGPAIGCFARTVGAGRVAGIDAVATQAERRTDGETGKRAAVRDRVVGPRIRNVGIERARAVDVGAEDVGVEHRPEQHRVLASDRDGAPRSGQADPGLPPERAAALREGAGIRREALLEDEHRAQPAAEVFAAAKAEERGQRPGCARHPVEVLAFSADAGHVLDRDVDQPVDRHRLGDRRRRCGGDCAGDDASLHGGRTRPPIGRLNGSPSA